MKKMLNVTRDWRESHPVTLQNSRGLPLPNPCVLKLIRYVFNLNLYNKVMI